MVFAAFWLFPRGAGAAVVCKKEIPEITFKNLSPPYKNYDYFENHHLFPFEYHASSFSLINAWWLAEASMLVYADEAYVTQRFSQAGLTHIQFFNRSSTQCFVAANDRFAIVAFRGSEIWKRDEPIDPRRIIADLITDIDIRLSPWNQGGRVHRGFKAALDDVWDDLLPAIEKLQAQGLKIWMTGHSLGTALATLAADRLQTVQGLYTFGSPRVGDQAFKDRFRPGAFRVVNGSDIVASVPPAGFFRHVGEFKWIEPKNGSRDRYDDDGENDDAPFREDSKVNGSAREDAKINSAVFIPSPVRDHVPLLYAILLWNEMVENLKSNGN